jgi:hypothetical protein
MSLRRRHLCLAGGLVLAGAGSASCAGVQAPPDPRAGVATRGFPRLMGMNIGEKHYDDPAYRAALARLDVVILGFHRVWRGGAVAIRQAVRQLKALNPALLVGQYTVMNELRDVAGDVALDDVRAQVNAAGWWLRNAAGERVQWTPRYRAWEVNFTRYAAPDASGARYPQWLAARDHRVYFEPVPEFDICYTDNVMHRPRVRADWTGNGANDPADSARILQAWRRGYVDWWDSIRSLAPGRMIVGNTDGDLSPPEFAGQLEGAFLEGLMGRPWSIGTRRGWSAALQHYRTVKANLRAPGLVGFNVAGRIDDYRFFRLAYATCLLDDGYFSFTDQDKGYSSVPWFDEYEQPLGLALSPPPAGPWQGGVWRRDFERGVVLVNPGPLPAAVRLEDGLIRLAGRQDPVTNNGQALRLLQLPPRDGVVLLRSERP